MIDYRLNETITADQFIHLLNKTSLGVRRPLENRECVEGMLNNSNLCITAWLEGKLIGIARSMTDFHYSCYLSDLAVHEDHQQQGIGKQLIAKTQQQLGPECKLILLAAPAASEYYQPLGFDFTPRCWVLEPDVKVTSE